MHEVSRPANSALALPRTNILVSAALGGRLPFYTCYPSVYFCCCYCSTHTHTHTHTRTTHTLIHSPSLTHTHTHSSPLTHTHTHTHTRPLTRHGPVAKAVA